MLKMGTTKEDCIIEDFEHMQNADTIFYVEEPTKQINSTKKTLTVLAGIRKKLEWEFEKHCSLNNDTTWWQFIRCCITCNTNYKPIDVFEPLEIMQTKFIYTQKGHTISVLMNEAMWKSGKTPHPDRETNWRIAIEVIKTPRMLIEMVDMAIGRVKTLEQKLERFAIIKRYFSKN